MYDIAREDKQHYNVHVCRLPTWQGIEDFDHKFYEVSDIAKPHGIATRRASPQGKETINGKYYDRDDYFAMYIWETLC